MQSWFPTPYPDEILVSVLARYHQHNSNPSFKLTMLELYGRSLRPAWDLPSHLARLVSTIRSCIIPETLVRNHTLFPYFEPFLDMCQAQRLFESMLGDHGGPQYLSGVIASKVKVFDGLKCCPECIRQDIECYGEPFWHRSHQLPGTLICPLHNIWIYSNCPTCGCALDGDRIQELPILNSFCKNGHLLQRCDKPISQHLIQIARDNTYILQQSIPSRSLSQIKDDYICSLQGMRLATENGRVRMSDLIQMFSDRFCDDTLHTLELTRIDSWLARMVRKPRSSHHPLLHVLLMEFLSGSVQEFFTARQFEPFGIGPWPCLNRASTHFCEKVVNKVEVAWSNKNGRPIGRFSCDCGFVYTRKGPDKIPEDKYKYSKVIRFGEVWESKLAVMSKETPSIRALARQMVTDSKVILKHLSASSVKVEQKTNAFERDSRRQTLLETINGNPSLSRTQIRKINPKDYTWLYRNDLDWLMSVLPPKQKSSGNHSGKRVNWEERDLNYSAIVETALEQLKSVPGKPVRITMSLLGKVTGLQAHFHKNLNKLPFTKQILHSATESVLEHQKRKVDWAISEFVISGEYPATWKVLRKAGIRSEADQAVYDFIEFAQLKVHATMMSPGMGGLSVIHQSESQLPNADSDYN